MKVLGLALSAVLVMTVLVGMVFAEKSTDEYKQKTKHQIKKDIKEIKKPSEDKTVKITKITKSRTLSILHIVSLEICAGRERLYSPEIDLKSDMDSITVKVYGLIMPKTCKPSEFFIRAEDPNSISVGFSKQTYHDNR
ncbi:MAG: hypothetical protein ACT4NT_03720 [Nitrososphaerota archaeon]